MYKLLVTERSCLVSKFACVFWSHFSCVQIRIGTFISQRLRPKFNTRSPEWYHLFVQHVRIDTPTLAKPMLANDRYPVSLFI